MPARAANLAIEQLEQSIHLIRGQKVLLDRDLAALYGVTTSNFNKAVRRNIDRFPADFMLKLNRDEAERLRFQFGILKRGHHFKYMPFAFTEQGVAMLSSVLNSPRAIQVNIAIMRVFVQLRETLSLHKELAHKLADLERKIEGHAEHIRTLFDAIRQLMAPPPEAPPSSQKENEMVSMSAKNKLRTARPNRAHSLRCLAAFCSVFVRSTHRDHRNFLIALIPRNSLGAGIEGRFAVDQEHVMMMAVA